MNFFAQLVLAVLVLARPNSATSQAASLWQRFTPGSAITVSSPGIPQPVKTGLGVINLGAKGVVALDRGTGTVLFDQNAAQMLPIASVTKLATTAVILRDHQTGEVISVPTLPAYPPGAVILPVHFGENFTVEQMIKAMLVPSANNAADTLAIDDSQSLNAFAAKANNLVAGWGITGVKVADANGLNPNSQASPLALAKLSDLLLHNQLFAQTVSSPQVTVSDTSGRSFNLTSTNHLLTSDKRITGIKTGYTLVAGENLVALANIKGHEVITVVLDSPDRFAETEALVNNLEQNWSWQ